MAKKGLIGFANLSYFPLTENTATKYTPGTKASLVGARSCTVEDVREEYKIPGDDGIYDSGSDLQSVTLTINVNEMDLKDLAALSGAYYDDAAGTGAKELCDSAMDAAPMVALTFSSMRRDGEYRMFRYYNAKLMSAKVDLRTKGDTGNEVNQYQLTFSCTPRPIIDVTATPAETKQMLRVTKDTDGSSVTLAWLDTIPAVQPQLGGVVLSGAPQVGVETSELAITYLLTPSEAPTLTYQWQVSDTEEGTFSDLDGETSATTTPLVGDVGKFLRCVVTASGSAVGTKNSNAIVILSAE